VCLPIHVKKKFVKGCMPNALTNLIKDVVVALLFIYLLLPVVAAAFSLGKCKIKFKTRCHAPKLLSVLC
jgi:hypothetical protein